MDVTDLSFLVGHAVEQIWVWGPVRLVFSSTDPHSLLDVQEPRYINADGVATLVNFTKDPDGSAVILQLLWKEVTSAQAVDGVLRVEFETGVAIEDDPLDGYEGWCVECDGRVLQCMTDGEVVQVGGGGLYVPEPD